MKRDFKILDGGADSGVETSPEDSRYPTLITENLEYIEKQCFKAVRLKSGGLSDEEALAMENEAIELFNLVLDILRKEDYKVLKEFKGNSRITTYFTAIISRQAVDMIRKKRGRSREKERAKEFGEVGLAIYREIIKNGRSPSDVWEQFKSDGFFARSLEELEAIAAKIKSTEKPIDLNQDGIAVKEAVSIGVDGYVIPDPQMDPGKVFEEQQRRQTMQKVIRGIINQLSGEERLLLRMRFPYGEDEKPKSVDQVSKVLGISQKAVYKRITRLMEKCREQLGQQGVNIHDLL